MTVSVLPSRAGVCRWGGVWNLVVAVWWVGLAHCWVLKNQAGPSDRDESGVFWASLEDAAPGWVGWLSLVGLLFEICIVDASILHRCRSSARPLVGVWVVGVLVRVFVVVVVVLCL